MRRLVTSWIAMGGVLLALTVGTGLLLRQLQRETLARAQQGQVQAAEIVTTLIVRRNVVAADFDRPTLSAVVRQDMDADIATLLSGDQLDGLEIWQLDGHLLYADQNQPAAKATLSPAQVRRARLGQPWITVSSAADGLHDSTLEVFIPFEAGLVEVLIPESAIAGEVNRSTRELYGIGGLLLFAVVGVLFALRRRLLAREYEAVHDPLTGLPNRLALLQATEAAIARTKGDDEHAALLILDIDGFKTINDTLGHPAGDALLIQVSASLKRAVRPPDLVTRLGGDEFAILLTRLPQEADAATIAAHILVRLTADSFRVNGIELNVDASIGVALIPAHGDDVDLLLQHADVAMYLAKHSNSGVAVYDEASDPHDVSQLGLLVELKRGIENDELVLHYQPKTDLLSGDLLGVEALVRWDHPTRGQLPPGVFIPLAENTGLMAPLTTWVLRTAIAQASQWHRSGLMIPVAVNISPRSLLNVDLPRALLTLLAQAGLPADLLELEITETAIMTDPARASRVLGDLQAMGIRVAIDDFGVGYTSLAYLKSLPVHTLKIDRAFISEMLHSEQDQAIAESVISLGHKLGLTVLAEGIENQAVLDRLRALNCDQGQGYHLSRPLPVDQLNAWITDHIRHGDHEQQTGLTGNTRT